jgi:hypothetical protein
MAFITLIIGAILGFIGGMIVSAGNWRNALAKLGACATKASQTPAAPAPAPAGELSEK